jgi:hypothetical protein
VHYIARVLFLGAAPEARRFWLNRRDWVNLAGGRFISLFDPILHLGLPYHLAQAIPGDRLESPDNPLRRTQRPVPGPAPSTAPGTSAPGTAPGTSAPATAPRTQPQARGTF